MQEYIKKLIFPFIISNLVFPILAIIWILVLDGEKLFLFYISLFGVALCGYLVYVLLAKFHVAIHIVIDIVLGFLFAYLLFPDRIFVMISVGIVLFIIIFVVNLMVSKNFLVFFCPKLLFAVILFYFISQIAIEFTEMSGKTSLDSLRPYVLVLGVLWLLFTIFSTNWLFVHNSAYMISESGPPKKVKRGNRLMILAFTVVTTIFVFFNVLAGAVKNAFDYLLRALGYLADLISKLFMSDLSATNETLSEEIEIDIGEEIIEKTSPFWALIGKILLAIIFIAAIGVIIFLIVKGLIALYKKVQKSIKVFFNEWQSSKSYFDEEEQLFSWSNIREDAKEAFNAFKKRFKRRVRLDSLPDNKSKIRMLYKWTLQKTYLKDKSVLSKTPNEYLDNYLKDIDNSDEFIESYNRARFGDKDIEDSKIESSKSIYKKV